ncbi:fibrillin-3-like [Watersipora subatra]|uniref:fibrillin-3-like n=1 Tax=Watersipora subatra TaxID=2589382 RepID=UPI00355C28D7
MDAICKSSGTFCSGGCFREQRWCIQVPECDGCASGCSSIGNAVCENNECVCPSNFQLSENGKYCMCNEGLAYKAGECQPATLGSRCTRVSALACTSIPNTSCHETQQRCRCINGYTVRVEGGKRVCREEYNRASYYR